MRRRRRRPGSRTARRRTSRTRTRSSFATRSAAAKKAARTRKRNKAKRSAAARKAARTRKRNASRKRRSYARANPTRTRSRSRRRTRSRRRSGGRRRSMSLTRRVRSALRPRSVQSTLVTSVKVGVGWGGANAIRNVESMAGVDGLMARIPPGVASKIAEYALRILNIGVLDALVGVVGAKSSTRAAVKSGALANLGVKALSDVSGFFGEPGAMVREHLADYQIVGGPGASAMRPVGYAPAPEAGLAGYLTAGGSPVMPEVVDASVGASAGFLGY